MEKIHRTTGRISSATWLAILLIAVGTLQYGCATMIEYEKATMIKEGVTTRQEVKKLMGDPVGEKNNGNTYIYSKVNVTAEKYERIAQEFDVSFDESGIVSKTFFLDVYKSALVGEADPLLLYESMSSFEIGNSTFSQSRAMNQPFVFMDIYENGRLIEHAIGIHSSSYAYGPLQKLPFVYTVTQEDGTFTYNLGFTETGLLKSATELTDWTKEHVFPASGGGKSADKLPFQEIKNPPPDTALIYIYRPNTYALNPQLSDLSVNGKVIAKFFDKGEYTNYYATPGELVIRIKPSDLSSKGIKLRLIVEKGQVYYVSLEEWIVFDPKEVSKDEALTEISECVHY